MNQSKVRDPRFWRRWIKAGAVKPRVIDLRLACGGWLVDHNVTVPLEKALNTPGIYYFRPDTVCATLVVTRCGEALYCNDNYVCPFNIDLVSTKVVWPSTLAVVDKVVVI